MIIGKETKMFEKVVKRISATVAGCIVFILISGMYLSFKGFQVDENGNFYTAQTFVQPQKPDVYYMPESLSALCTNKTSGKIKVISIIDAAPVSSFLILCKMAFIFPLLFRLRIKGRYLTPFRAV